MSDARNSRLASPHAAALAATVEAAYALTPARVSPGLEVCGCPVCMTEETRRAIIDTPVRDLPAALIREYSNSAHGVPGSLDDLAALLPRYMELLAQDEEVDHTGVGAELSRFGDARRMGGRFPAPALARVWDAWARLMILHFGVIEARAGDADLTPLYLTEILLAGGTPVPVLTEALEALFSESQGGAQSRWLFMAGLGRAWNGRLLNLYAARFASDEARAGLADWLNDVLSAAEVQALLSAPEPPGPACPPDWSGQVRIAAALAGQLSGRSFPENR